MNSDKVASSRDGGALRLLPSFAVAAAVTMVLVALVLGVLFRELSTHNLVAVAENKNVALARLMANSLWPRYADFLRGDGARLTRSELAEHANTRAIHAAVDVQSRGLAILKVKIYTLDGRTVFSTDPRQLGEDKSASEGFRAARGGQVHTTLSHRDRIYARSELISDRNVLATYIPIRAEDNTAIDGVFEVYSDVTALSDAIAAQQKLVMAGVVALLGLAYVILFYVVRQADRLLERHHYEHAANEARIQHQAYHDSLTGLPNRALFVDRLEHAMAKAQRNERLLALMFLDLDRFKQVNDNFGHEGGDQLLRMAAERFKTVVRDGDTVARLGGDEFTIIMEDMRHIDEAAAVAERLLSVAAQPFELAGKEASVSVSIGITIFPFDDTTVEALLRHADTAMYSAKQRGRNRFELYRAELSQENSRRMQLEQELRRALVQEEFELFYQPKVNLVSGSMAGMEALLRWRHPDRGLVSPGEFIPTLEETGLIVPVGEWVLREACRANRRWQDQGLPALTVSVNVSAEQLRQEGFVELVAQVLAESGLQPGYLELEMTESCLLEETEASTAMVKALKSLGVRIAIDDFGTGYASMTYLKRYPVDVLKIDQSFMQRLSSKSEDTAIVTAIMALVHSLRLEVVAEGVETAQQLTFLYALGCNVIQGFLFSRPLPEDEFVRQLLNARNFRDQLDRLELLGAQSA